MHVSGPTIENSTDTLPAQRADTRRGRPPVIVHRTPEEHASAGEAARKRVPHDQHAGFDVPPKRDPIALLESQAATRVPDLVPIRYGRMVVSPFTFYRGAALVMAHDLAGTAASGLTTQLCGDAHLSNFGLFASPERRLVFDINDFDETCPGPWEWDLKRLTASFAVACREAGLSAKQRRAVVRNVAKSYRGSMAQFATMRDLDVWYARADISEIRDQFAQQLKGAGRKKLDATVAKARTRDSMQALNKLTQLVDGQRRIISDPPLIVTVRDLLPEVEGEQFEKWIHDLVRQYRRSLQSDRRQLVEHFEAVDMARKVVGVGSVGTRCWIILMLGRDDSDPLFLQAKEAPPSVLTAVGCKNEYHNEGERVVAGQRLMQGASDIFLGWQRARGLDDVERDFYIRQLRDWKGSAELDGAKPEGLMAYGNLCGWTLARAHARSGDRIAISTYLGETDTFDRAVAEFSEAYADQNERDHRGLVEAIDSGRLVAQKGL
ncbi:MAG: DUF2252 domain-containing protein [Actinomycetes bacterium]